MYLQKKQQFALFSFIILSLISILFFFLEINHSSYTQFEYKNAKALNKSNILHILKEDYSALNVETSNQIINPSFFNPNFTYSITINNNDYYFRFLNLYKSNSNIRLTGIYWLSTIPEFTDIESYFTQWDIKRKQNGEITVCTFGDLSIYSKNGKFLRKFLLKQNQNLVFNGRNFDLYGFPHEGYIQAPTAKLKSIPNTDYLIIMLSNLSENYQKELIKLAIDRTNTKIIVVTDLSIELKLSELSNVSVVQYNIGLQDLSIEDYQQLCHKIINLIEAN